jgi:hypothetical protein
MPAVGRAPAKGNLIASLLAGSWRSPASSSISVNEKQLEEVAPLLCASGAAGLGWWRVRQTELSSTDCGRLLQQAYRLQALQVAIHERQITKVFSLLRQAAVEPLLVKGWAAASLYPDAALRPYGDIDLLVTPKQFKTAQKVLTSEEVRDCWVDLHTKFSELEGRSTDELFLRSQIVNLGGEHIRVLSPEDQLALLSIHLLKHGAWRPLWLCDIAAAVESIPNKFNWKICFGNNGTRREWISVAILLSGELLKANLEKAYIQGPKKIPNWVVKSVLRQWSRLFPPNHLPIRPPPLMAQNLKRRSQILKAALERWPDPITATFKLNGSFGSLPRFPYQLGEFSFRAGRFLARNATNLF